MAVYIEHHHRRNNYEWSLHELRDLSESITLESLGLTMLLQSFHDFVRFGDTGILN